ncbi:hypothetical protein BRAS3843_3040079 [Bradyrhizobium sp. STM 3843]|nr:hypothetical protein BRAS3843_3040079 [Bradyrhizobium sp. STM 3843]
MHHRLGSSFAFSPSRQPGGSETLMRVENGAEKGNLLAAPRRKLGIPAALLREAKVPDLGRGPNLSSNLRPSRRWNDCPRVSPRVSKLCEKECGGAWISEAGASCPGANSMLRAERSELAGIGHEGITVTPL